MTVLFLETFSNFKTSLMMVLALRYNLIDIISPSSSSSKSSRFLPYCSPFPCAHHLYNLRIMKQGYKKLCISLPNVNALVFFLNVVLLKSHILHISHRFPEEVVALSKNKNMLSFLRWEVWEVIYNPAEITGHGYLKN